MPKLVLLLIEVIAFAILAVVATSDFGFSDGMKITVSYFVAYLIPRIILARARGTSMAAQVVLFVLSAFLIVMAYSCLLHWTGVEGYALDVPNLKNDARHYYKWALHHYDGRLDPVKVAFPGFPLMMVALWKVLGLNVIWPQAMNMMFTLIAVVLTGMTTRRLLAGRVSASMQTLLVSGMIMSCLLFYYLLSGISILKEASTYLSVSMAGFALSSMATVDDDRYRLWRDIVLFVLACVLMAFVRTTFLYFIGLGVVVMALPHWRRDWGMALALLAVVGISLVVGDMFASYSFDRHAIIVEGGWSMHNTYATDTSRPVYRRLIGYYFLYTPLHKLLVLPVTLSLQYLIPLPWISEMDEAVIFNFFIRISYGWYLVGGIALFYYFFLIWRRHEGMGAWPWWPALSFIIIAYIMGGSVTRYVLPFEPLFVPVAIYVICRLVEGKWRVLFKRWFICYVILLTVALLICMEIQLYTFSTMFHTVPLGHYLKHFHL